MEEAPINDGAAAQDGGDNTPLYAIQPIPGMGLGLIATTRIPKGTRILSELPIFKISYAESDPRVVMDHVANALRDLDDVTQREFLRLENVNGQHDNPFLGITLSNVKPLGPEVPEGGLFLDAARINHACRPNAHESWNENIGRLTVHAIRDIGQGEEITTSYLIETMEHDKRQRELKNRFRLDCGCSLCSAPLSRRKESDAWVQKIRMFENLPIHKWYVDGSPGTDYEGALLAVRGLLYFCKREGLYDARISSLYHDAFQCSMKNGDEARGRIFAERAYAARVVVEGDDSPEAAKLAQFVRQPARHAQVPRGMGEVALENWLWKQDPSFSENEFEGSDDIVLVRVPR